MRVDGRPRQAGFSTLECLIALAVTASALTVGAFALHALDGAAARVSAASAERAARDDVVARLRADADGAIALGVPVRDVAGASNADGHELDFASKDAAGRPFTRAYVRSGSALVAYRSDGRAGGWKREGALLRDVDAFVATARRASALVDPPLAGYRPADRRVAIGEGDLVAGNGLVRVDLADAFGERAIVLTAGVRPSGFTVVLAPPTGSPVGGGPPPPTPPGTLFRVDASGLSPQPCWHVGPGGVPHKTSVLAGTLYVDASTDGGAHWTRACTVAYGPALDCAQAWTASPDPCPNGLRSNLPG